jgi:hypothetical protein
VLAKRAICSVLGVPPGKAVTRTLLDAHIENENLDFAYAYLDGNRAKLIRVSRGKATQVPTLHIGSEAAFRRFQHIRNDDVIDHAPSAMHTLMMGQKEQALSTVKALSRAIGAMWRRFASTTDRDVGGWVTAFSLDVRGGAQPFSYAYSVSDGVIGSLAPGQAIPHGTATGGGFSFSHAPVGALGSMVVYWLQKPGGLVLRLEGCEYKTDSFSGGPSEFKAAVQRDLGLTVDLWFNDSHPELRTIKSISYMDDQTGRTRIAAVTDDKGEISLLWLQNTEDSFQAQGAIPVEKGNASEQR